MHTERIPFHLGLLHWPEMMLNLDGSAHAVISTALPGIDRRTTACLVTYSRETIALSSHAGLLFCEDGNNALKCLR